MTKRQNSYVVVYQFGKVASTSIVATLNDLPGMQAVQSHFLGEKSLSAIIPTVTNADVPDYFHKHQMGQLVTNIRITRKINLIRNGKLAKRLLIISLAREPLEWVRSGVVQDIEGYVPILTELATRLGLPESEDVVPDALAKVISESAVLIAAKGGVDDCITALQTEGGRFWDGTMFENDVGLQRMFRLFVRPFDWFEQHFEDALGLGLKDMQKTERGLEYSDDTADFFILRYEDLETALPAYLESIGAPVFSALQRENTSGEKLLSKEIRDVFQGPDAALLAAEFRKSRYSRVFGYDTP